MKIEPIYHIENSLRQDEYKQRKKMIKKKKKKFDEYLQVEIGKKDMYDKYKEG